MNNLFVVGVGPGDGAYLTPQAAEAIRQAQVICGYTLYVELLGPLIQGKECHTSAMRQEVQRCRWALDAAQSGRDVAMVCSGDAGVYGMAGLILELWPEYPAVDVTVVPGITAALSGAAILGAPLGHDFCVISLSDLLTPWDTIRRRLAAAAQGDFAICLYNPASKKRPEHLRRACEILLQWKQPDTVCGWVRNIGRSGQQAETLTLQALKDAQVDMFTTVFIGSSQTRLIQGRMVTPRGYDA